MLHGLEGEVVKKTRTRSPTKSPGRDIELPKKGISFGQNQPGSSAPRFTGSSCQVTSGTTASGCAEPASQLKSLLLVLICPVAGVQKWWMHFRFVLIFGWCIELQIFNNMLICDNYMWFGCGKYVCHIPTRTVFVQAVSKLELVLVGDQNIPRFDDYTGGTVSSKIADSNRIHSQ